MSKRIAILGSTGSIGTQALQVIEEHADLYEASVLTANTQADLLIEQARRHKPNAVVIADERYYERVSTALADLPVKVYAGAEALAEVVTMEEVDVELAAMVGGAGRRPTAAAIEAGKTIALANKETLVVAGELITELALRRRVAILPVDSEHSAIFQSLMGEDLGSVEEIILTASGGPFRKLTREELSRVTPEQALAHPNWDMGAKITIDSATMMNKGFEVIEAKWLFGVEADRIRVVVHPQSVVHSAVQFRDGSVKAQLGVPDMRLPIQLALTYPRRLPSTVERLNWWAMPDLTFAEPDTNKFPCLRLAYDALSSGGSMPCTLNAANEVVNLAFRQGRISFERMANVVERTMEQAPHLKAPSLQDLFEADEQARRIAQQLIN